MSQLVLAAEAQISPRHLSFLETGRAQPSRDMVQLLASVLAVPLGERNALLLAAGYAPAYGERPLADPELEQIRRALQFILQQQEPYPAFVVDAQWNILMANGATRRIFGQLLELGEPAEWARNAMRLLFHPQGVRRFIVNWEELAGQLIQTVHREAAASGSEASARLRDELLSYPGVPPRWKIPDPLAALPPLLTLQIKKGDTSLAFFETITTFSNPFDITLQRLKIECFYPADRATEEAARALAAAS
jgi:transcriptional regulator with XRE-family HTH domain